MLATLLIVCLSCPGGQGTAANSPSWGPGLSDRELAIGRWFSHLTFLADRTQRPWPVWHDDGKQLGITSLRYQLAFAGYGCAAMGAKTPAYRELAARQLDDLCQRMIDERVWRYVTHYWKYGSNPPDPCLYENVMYTGHLTQLMCLYELLTGDTRYSDRGWDFVGQDGRRIHYDLRRAVERLHAESANNPHGGICCEPGLVFATCNSHSAASLVLYDLLHGTRYADVNAKWFAWMSEHFRAKPPVSREFLYVMYNERNAAFLPVGDVGADCWALGWGCPWFRSMDFAREGWRHLRENAVWNQPTPETLYARGNLLMGCCGGGSTPLSNSFVPLLAVQVEGRQSPCAHKVLGWLEANFGREADMDGDGHRESYYYQTDKALAIAATGNISAALATDGDSLRRLYRTSRREILAAPSLTHVDYPNVCVRTAEYLSRVLRFTLLKGRPGFQGKTRVVCAQIAQPAAVLRDGKPYGEFVQTGSELAIQTDVDREHVFEVVLNRQARIGEESSKGPR